MLSLFYLSTISFFCTPVFFVLIQHMPLLIGN